mmetsp:Transcript_54188/g.151274  ORF Transcript_54188/g.151274 Transcript_54188/m.151274 type:complete len:247 (+) Transcript_54188:941-1681(+)
MPAPVDIVELGLGHAIVNVDGWEQELALRSHLLQPVDASGGLLADALALRGHARVLRLVGRDGISQQLQDALEFGVVRAGRIGQGSVLRELFLELLALVDQQRRVAAVVDELVAAVRAWHCHHLLGTPPVLLQGLALPCEHGGCLGLRDGRSRVVLRAEDVAGAPAHFGPKRVQGLDEDAGLDSHVQRPVDVHPLEGLLRAELLAGRHEARHLVLRQAELFAAELGEAHVLDLGLRHGAREMRRPA